jgi:hypothetical protein
MKKNKMLFASLLLLLFATYSCAVEEIQPEPIPISSEIQKKVNPIFLEHDLSVYKIKPIWKSLITFDNIDAVEFNFTQDNKTTIPLSKNGKIRGRQRLLLTFDDGKIRETIIEYIPSDDYMGDIKEINSGNFKSKQFDGEITFKNPKKDAKIVWYLSKGLIVKKAKSSSKKNKPSKTARYVPVYGCHTYWVCVGEGAEERCIDKTTCGWEDVWEEDNPETGIPPADPYDCAVDPSWPWCQDGDGEGDGSGSNSTYYQIINLLTGKVNCIYNNLMNSSTNFKTSIQKFDGEFAVSHLKLSINNNLPTNVYAETQPPVSYITEIQFSESSIQTLSDLGKAGVFAHEIIHAEIFRKMLSAAELGTLDTNAMTIQQQVNFVNNLKDNFPGLYDYYAVRYQPTWNHNMMAEHYRSTIADITQQFDNNRLPRSTYEAIAWVGLGKLSDNKTTIAWNNLTPNQKAAIITLINQHFYNGPANCN